MQDFDGISTALDLLAQNVETIADALGSWPPAAAGSLASDAKIHT
jgi:hypothetical protein